MDWERRAVLRGAALTVAGGVAVGRGAARSEHQQVDTSLAAGVTLFDLDDDGNFDARVEPAPEAVRDGDHSEAVRITSDGRQTVDYAAAIVEPSAPPRLGDLERLDYEYYEGPDNSSPDAEGGADAPGETFVVVENEDGRHGMYLTADAGDPEQWLSFDVLARLRGDASGTDGWFEYTTVEDGYEGQTFRNAVERFGEGARLVRVGVGRGNAVTPATLDVAYDNLRIDGERRSFPTSVTERVSHASPF